MFTGINEKAGYFLERSRQNLAPRLDVIGVRATVKLPLLEPRASPLEELRG
jgi:hypothetical protein